MINMTKAELHKVVGGQVHTAASGGFQLVSRRIVVHSLGGLFIAFFGLLFSNKSSSATQALPGVIKH